MYGLVCYHKVLILSPLMYYVATTLYYTLAVQKCIKMYRNVSSCSYNKGQLGLHGLLTEPIWPFVFILIWHDIVWV